MRLKLDLDGVKTIFEIRKYHKSTEENWDEEWCKVTFSFICDNWLEYGRLDEELLLCGEIEELRDYTRRLLLDEIEDTAILTFLEPDFEFTFCPKRIDNQLSLFEEHPQVKNAYAEWKIAFWNDGLTDNYMCLHLSEDDLECLKNYLNLVTGTIDKNNPVIQDMVNKGILCE